MRLEIGIPFDRDFEEVMHIGRECEELVIKHGGEWTDSGAGFGYRDLGFEIEDYSITDLVRKFLTEKGFENFFCDVV